MPQDPLETWQDSRRRRPLSVFPEVDETASHTSATDSDARPICEDSTYESSITIMLDSSLPRGDTPRPGSSTTATSRQRGQRSSRLVTHYSASPTLTTRTSPGFSTRSESVPSACPTTPRPRPLGQLSPLPSDERDQRRRGTRISLPKNWWHPQLQEPELQEPELQEREPESSSCRSESSCRSVEDLEPSAVGNNRPALYLLPSATAPNTGLSIENWRSYVEEGQARQRALETASETGDGSEIEEDSEIAEGSVQDEAASEEDSAGGEGASDCGTVFEEDAR